jgi:hypothetical protein
MQAREVGQIGIYTQNINQSINQGALLCCNPTFFATKATTLSSECPLQEAQKKFLKKAKSDFSILSSLQNSGQGES